MTTVAEAPTLPAHLNADASGRLGASLGDSPRVAALRAQGAAAAERLPLPTRADRPWRYADLSALDLGEFTPATGKPGAGVDDGDGPTEIVDGTITQRGPDNGVTIAGADGIDAAGRASELLGTIVRPDTNLFVGLHYAFLDGLVVVHVPDDLEVALPVRLVRRFERAGQLGAPHTLIVTGRNARVSVIEEYHSSESAMAVLPAVEVAPGPGAEVRYTVIHRWGERTRVFAEQHTHSARDSAIVSLAIATGGAAVKSHVTSTLEGRGSSSEIYGLFLGERDQQFDLYTIQNHVGADTRSDLLYKSALYADARSVYYGLTRVGLEARNADANQENRNLLLSKTAKADSDPVLEILTNDVIRAAHGATAGPVDQNQLFYMEARGIQPERAESLLVAGFLGEVLDRVPDETVRRELAASLGQTTEEVL